MVKEPGDIVFAVTKRLSLRWERTFKKQIAGQMAKQMSQKYHHEYNPEMIKTPKDYYYVIDETFMAEPAKFKYINLKTGFEVSIETLEQVSNQVVEHTTIEDNTEEAETSTENNEASTDVTGNTVRCIYSLRGPVLSAVQCYCLQRCVYGTDLHSNLYRMWQGCLGVILAGCGFLHSGFHAFLKTLHARRYGKDELCDDNQNGKDAQ
jgi:hypothetical protein